MRERFASIIDELGGNIAVASLLRVDPTTVSGWKSRRSIPPQYWPVLVREAEAQGLSGITFEALALLEEEAARLRKREPLEARA